MNKATAGWITFITAIGMMFGLLAPEVAKITSWGEIYQPAFVAVIMAHFAVVVTAFVGGKMIPTDREPGMRTRSTDTVSQEKLNELNQNGNSN